MNSADLCAYLRDKAAWKEELRKAREESATTEDAAANDSMPINWADMRKWLDGRFNGRAAHLESAKRAVLQITTTPLSKDIQSYKLPQGFSLPHFQKYDGRMDPVTHLKDF